MNRHQILLVQETFDLVLPVADTIALLFYTRLFELDGTLHSMFTGDMEEQRRKLMDTLTFIVTELNDIGPLVPVAEALARRHHRYGVTPQHYALVGDALLWSLEQGLGAWFTPDAKVAWLMAYRALSDVMTKVKSLPPEYQ